MKRDRPKDTVHEKTMAWEEQNKGYKNKNLQIGYSEEIKFTNI